MDLAMLVYACGVCNIDGVGLCFGASISRHPRQKKRLSAYTRTYARK
jgi:hypothetical protein